MREAPLPPSVEPLETASLLACLATILELPVSRLPVPAAGDIWTLSRWLGGLGLGLAPVADPGGFSWPGPWIARIEPPAGAARFVVMYGVPSGVVWDPASPGADLDPGWITGGRLVAAADVALALPPRPTAPAATGTLERICIAPRAGEPASLPDAVRALPGRGLDGDRHVSGAGTFPSGAPGSALTLIDAEVCESFD